MKKKIISLVLAVVMIVGMLPLSAIPAAAATSGPKLVPDFNRDGVIDTYDRERAMAETDAFTIWLNDDDDAEGAESDEGKGDSNTAEHNVPSGNDDMDYDDDRVNGRCDLLDFFPVLVDVSEVPEWQNYTWRIKTTGDASVNVVFTKLSAGNAGSFYTKEVKALDGITPLYEADTTPLYTEAALPEEFLHEGTGVLLIEGSALGEGNIVLEGIKDSGDSVILSLPVNVANVEDMYRTINLRQGGISETDEPAVRKDADSDGRQFVFVHGYNVTHDEAKGEASDFYKKLWQTGSDSMFTAVEWDSDESRMKILGENLTFNYYANVENAFAAAEAFKNECDRLPGRKYLVGHSLGNMLICSAIQDFGLEYEKYFMLNAAIAGEAFDKNAVDDGMIDDYWENNIPESERASHWYESFSQDTEYRSTLTWKGRFEDVKKNVINLYSPSDEFLANCPDDINRKADESEVWNTFTEKLTKGGFWAFTEKIKGTDYIAIVNNRLKNFLDVEEYQLLMNCEGGWGLNEDYVPGDSSRANTRFTPFMDKRMAYEEALTISSSEAVEHKTQLLADAIPAESYAAGSNEVSTLKNINLESYIGKNEDWPSYIESEENPEIKNKSWKHNDTTEIAYYHTSKLYDYISTNPWDKLCGGGSLYGELEVSVSDDVKTIKLLNDITAGSKDAPFYVDGPDIKIILDLNGHSIDFSQAGGSAIVVRNAGDLTIIDSSPSQSGKIIGGTGQTLNKDDSKLYGGGVLVLNGKLTMTGGTVTGNSADIGGGIYVADGGELTVGGTAKIYGNLSKDGTADNNLYLQNNKYITVCTGSDGLETGAEIGISKTGNGRISANEAKADAKYFFSDAEGKIIKHETDGGGRLELADAPDIGMTVTFDMKGGSNGSKTAEARYAYAMPEITVPTKTGYTFDGYYDESGKAYYNASGKSVRNCDRQDEFILYAHWKNSAYNIIYRDKDGDDFAGEHEIGYPTTYTYGSETPLKRAVKKDCYFVGWFKESDCFGTPITSIGADCTEDITLYARWETHIHSYEWNNEVGTNGTHTLVCVNTDGSCEERVKAADCTFTKSSNECTVCGAKKFYHIHIYKWNNEVGTNGTHTLVCANTDGLCEKLTKTANCNYVNGFCTVCGAKEQGECYIARSWDSTKKQVISTEEYIPEDAVKITADTRELESGWYVLSESVTLPEGKHITVNGDVNLILCDGCELKIPSPGANCAGIELTDGGTLGASDSLTVYGQKNGTGSIVAIGGLQAAGIGSDGENDCGDITISGGIVTATGGMKGAGIGGGYKGDCGDIKIYGGTVTATGGDRGAGIGNGYDGNGGSITVYGGTVKAYGNNSRALGGDSSTFSKNKISIYGGDILADSKSSDDAVIAYSVKVYADSHNIFTVKGLNGTELPFSPIAEEKDLYNSLSGNKVLHIESQPAHTFNEYVDNGDGTHYGICVCGAYGNNEPHSFNEETGKCICGVSSDDCLEYRYYDEESGEFKTGYCSEYELIDKYSPAEWQGGKWYVVKGKVSINKRITVRKGDGTGVKLILTDGCKLILPNGISVNKTDNDENTLTIYAQSGGTGELLAGCSEFDFTLPEEGGTGELLVGGRDFNFTHAGIGGNAEHDSGTVNIHGGVVIARSYRGAGIGGGGSNTGNGGSGSVNIYGGTVNASSTYGVGIGGTAGSSIKIVGGLGSAKTEAGNTAIGCINNPGDYVDIGNNVRFYNSADKPITLPEGDEWAHQLAGKSYVKFAEADAKPLATPTAAYFSVSNRGQDSVYNGQPKQITLISPTEDMYNFSMKYQKNNGEIGDEDWGNATTTAPIDPGQYKILISVDGGANYAASDGDIVGDWTFTIEVAYFDRRWDENTKQVISTEKRTVNAQRITANTKELTGGWYFLYGEVEIDDAITVSGDAHIILGNDALFTVKNGIAVTNGANLTFYDQIYDQMENKNFFDKMGKVVVTNTYSGNAGIGSVLQGECGDITINGGAFYVQGGMNAAGIGAGADGKCGTITVNSGVILAVGNSDAENIGKGCGSPDVTVTIAEGIYIYKNDDLSHALFVNIEPFPETSPSCVDGHKKYFKNCLSGNYYTTETLEPDSRIEDIEAWLAGEGFTGAGDGKHADKDKDGYCDGCGTLAKANINFYISHGGSPAFTLPCNAGENLANQIDFLAAKYVEDHTLAGLENYLYSDGNFVGEYDLVPFGIESMDIFAVLAFEEKEPDDTHDGHKIYYENTQDGYFYKDSLCTLRIGDADALAEWLTTPVENGGGMIPKTGEQPLATPTADDFNFVPPEDCVYNGQPKQASVTTDKTGMGNITVKYQKKNGSDWDTATTDAPTEIGKYRVVISVNEGANYAASAADITSDSWVFEITAPPCEHESTTVSYVWGSNPRSCTASLVCDSCHAVLESETLSWMGLSTKTVSATKCTERSYVYFIAEFENELFGSVESEKEYFDPGPHHYVDYVCEHCGDEDFDAAQKDAIKTIDNTADHSDDEAIILIAENAVNAINDFRDEYNTVAEVLKIRDLTVSQITAIKKINAAAGNNLSRKVKAIIDIAKEDISSAESIEDVETIRDECLADIGKLTGTTHEHTFSSEWSYNETHHWHESTCEHTNIFADLAAHSFAEETVGNKTTYTCECGYQKFVYNSDEEGEIITGISYSGISLTLGSDIYINFYMNLNEGARQNGKMTFDIGGRIVTVDGKDAKYNEKEGKYYFRTPLTALEMAETVKATFNYNGVDYIQEYSVLEYIEAIVGGGDKYTAEMKTLAKKIANYGYYAQIYLESIHSNVDIVDSGVGYDRMEHFGGSFEINVEEAKKALADHKTSVSGSSENLSLYGTTVYFDSATALNYYVTVKNGAKPTAAAVNTATGKSKEIEIKLYKKNIYIVSVKDITATELADNITVTVNGEITFSGSVFAYCNSVVQAHSFEGATEKDAFAVNAMAAFYEYYDAAMEYISFELHFDMPEHYKVFTADGEEITGEKTVKCYRTFSFRLVPDENYKISRVISGWDIEPDDNGLYTVSYVGGKHNIAVYTKIDSYRLTVNVEGEDGGEMPDTKILFVYDSHESIEAQCWGPGIYKMDVPKGKSGTIVITKSGYQKYSQDFTADGTVEEISVSLVPESFSVTFNMMGHGEQISSQTVEKGGKVTKPTSPTADDKEFAGWYKDENCTEKWNFDTDTVAANTTLYAKWREKTDFSQYSLCGVINAEEYGMDDSALYSDNPPYMFSSDGKLTVTFSKVTFVKLRTLRSLYWYYFEENAPDGTARKLHQTYFNNRDNGHSMKVVTGRPVTFTLSMDEDGDLMLGYEVQPCTVSFNMMEHGIQIPDQIVKYNEKAQKPADPTAEGYTFEGWFMDETCTEPYYWSWVTEDITLYAKWTPIQ